MNNAARDDLLNHLQTAAEIELSTIPIYLYTYYSINRLPLIPSSSVPPARANQIQTFANKAGGMIMSVAVEEMLHLSLVCNIIRALGGTPQLAGKSPSRYPTNLPHHAAGFSVGLEPFSADQLGKFLQIELPAAPHAPAEGDNWRTLSQFYDYIRERIRADATDADFRHADEQLAPGKGYDPPNNADTIYPTTASYDPNAAAHAAVYPNARDSGDLLVVKSVATAIAAIDTICHQGEGYSDQFVFDDPSKRENTHYFKFRALRDELGSFSPEEIALFVYPYPVNPTTAQDTTAEARISHQICNAAYAYLFMMVEASYRLSGPAQWAMFNIGMHKGMIFVLDKIIARMRSVPLPNGNGATILVPPTFENLPLDPQIAKAQLVAIASEAYASGVLESQLLQRIKDLPDINVAPGGRVQF